VAVDNEDRRTRSAGWKGIYETLRTEILALTLPPGQPLDETGLAERFGLSRSPVREALIRLAAEELVVTLPNRSTIVAPIELANFPKYVDALDIAQRVTARLAAALRSDADLAIMASRQRAFEAAVKSGDHLAMSAANKDFHMAIAAAGRNPYFTAFYEKLLDQGRRMLHLHFRFVERGGDGYLLTDEHHEMIAAIEARDVERADKLAHDHTRQFRDSFLAFMKENYATDIALGQSAAE
jgi:DNA-binding GntR family transcriptional regulator